MDRRRFVIATTAAAASLATGQVSAEDAYPSHAITIINPYPPGGANELSVRPLLAVIEPAIKKPVVMETKAGAAGAIGAQFVASAKPDGYTLLTHNTAISGFPEVDRLFGRAPKFTNDSFIPIARLVADPCVLVVNDQQPYKSFKDFVDDAKKRPDAIVFSTAGFYAATHLPMAMITRATGIQLRHLPTNGGGPSLTALLGNNSNVSVLALSGTLAQIKAGKLKPLALMGGKRAKAIPDVPTMKELGFDIEYYLWVGIFAPKGTPDSAISVLRKTISEAAHSAQYKGNLDTLGLELEYMDAPEFAKFWAADSKNVIAAVDAIGKVQ
jgi:tripartite-type tricarboxylate transporter receptor subunit TctC